MATFEQGMLIFQQERGDPFATAVSKSISGGFAVNHVALCISSDLIIEACPVHGVRIRPIPNFIASAPYNILAQIRDRQRISRAVVLAQEWVGLPYNVSFYPEDPGFYCSELIVHAFTDTKGSLYFEEHAMNFSDETTLQLLPYWQHYYAELGLSVPQGVKGSHPQQLLNQSSCFEKVQLL